MNALSPATATTLGRRTELPASSLERLEPRIAPSGFASSGWLVLRTQYTAFGAGVSALLSAQAPDIAALSLSATPEPPEHFAVENAGFVIKSAVSIFDTPAYKGTIESFVVRRTATTDAVNLPVGGLDFYYQIALTSGSPNAEVSAVTLSLFEPYLKDAGIDVRVGPIVSTDPLHGKFGGTQEPVLFSYSAGAAQFDFATATQLGEKLTLDAPLSAWLVLRTNARSYDAEGSATITGNLSTSAAILAPTTTVPPPTPLVVTGAGTGSLVQVFDPATGALKESFNAFGPRHRYGVRVATGDVNGDGVEDIIVGSGRGTVGGAHVRVFDGANPTHPALPGVLGDFKPFGSGFLGAVNVAAGDVNGDGKADIIVAPAAGSSGEVRVFSGADGALLSRFTALTKVSGGVRVAAGDVDGDGRDEVIVGSGVGSTVRVFDGLTGVAEASLGFQAFGRSYKGGVTVAAGDTNGDGIDEIIVGSATSGNLVRIFDHTLTQLAEFQTTARRGVRLAATDVNGDGFADFITAKGAGENSAVSVFSGLTRTKLLDLSGYTPGGTAGAFVG